MSRPIQSTRVVPKSKTILERRRAKKDTYLNVTYQLQCLKTLHDELYPSVATNQNSKKSLQKVRELKAILRSQYRDNFPLPTLDRSIVLVLFDAERRPFFEFRHRPISWPESWPFFIDDNPEGNVVLYSEGIYDKVMEAFEEETEGEAGEEKISRFQKGKTDEMPVRTNIKKENDEVDDVEVIVLEDDNVANEHTVQKGNSQTIRPQRADNNIDTATATDGSDLTNTVNSAALSPPTTSQDHQSLETSVNESLLRKIKTPKNDSINRHAKKRPSDPSSNIPKRQHTLGADCNQGKSNNNNLDQADPFSFSTSQTTAISGSSTFTPNTKQTAVAEDFFTSITFMSAIKTDKLNCPVCSTSYEKTTLRDHINIVHLRKNLPYCCSFPDCQYTNRWHMNAYNHAKREHKVNPGQYIVQTEEGADQSSFTSSQTTVSSSTSQTPQKQATLTFKAEDYLKKKCPAYLTTKNGKVACPDCPNQVDKFQLKDHLVSVHWGLKPYRCTFSGCSYIGGWLANAKKHLKNVHKTARYDRYLLYQEE